MAETALRRIVTHGRTVCKNGSARCIFTEATHPTDATETLSDVKSFDSLPGPCGIPVLGTGLKYLINQGQMHEVQRDFHKRYGKIFKEKLGPVTNLSISDPALVEEILRSEGKFPFRPPYQSWILYNELHNKKGGTMTADGEHWKKCRSAMNPKFLRPKAVGEFVEGINDVVTSFVDRLRYLKANTPEGEHIPHLPNEMTKFTMEALGSVLLDKRFGCLEKEVEPKIQKFIDSIATMFLTGHQLMIFANIHQKYNTKPWQNHVQSWDTIYNIAQEYIDDRMKDVRERLSGDLKEGERVDFITYLVSNGQLSLEEIYTNITEVLLGGVDTAAHSLSFLLYLLAKNPESQDVLREEVDQVLEGRLCSYEDLQRMPFLKAVVKETLRLYPPIPINARVLQEDTVIDNTLIPKSTIVMLNNYTMSRDEKIFKDPDQFQPDRWLKPEAKTWHPFSSIPFGYGVRSCIGRRVAETEIYLVTAQIFQNFNLLLSDKFDIKPSVRTQLTPGPELPIVFSER